MAKGVYAGVGGVARKVKKGYIGVGSVARAIKKAYVGVGGVARPCWPAGEASYYGKITSLSYALQYLAAASIGNYALFAGGTPNNLAGCPYVNTYDASLTKGTATNLTTGAYKLTGASNGSYAIFGGGKALSGNATTVDGYNSSLVKSAATSTEGCSTGTNVGVYALFAREGNYATVYAFDGALARTSPTNMSSVRFGYQAATSNGSYALFAGGSPNGVDALNTVDAYNASLVRSSAPTLSGNRLNMGGARVGNYAIFCAGYTGSAYVSIVEAYSAALVKSTLAADSNRQQVVGVGNSDFAIFAGGRRKNDYTSSVMCYDGGLVQISLNSLSEYKVGHAGTGVGGYIIFAGGEWEITSDDYVAVSTADAYAA